MVKKIDKAVYNEILEQAISQIREARVLLAQQMNRSSNAIYWRLGKWLSEKKLKEGYGSGVVEQLSKDLKSEFPDMGLSPRNLWEMKRFYERYVQANEKLQRSVAVLPWRHNILLLQKIKNNDEAVEFYANEVIKKGWSKDVCLINGKLIIENGEFNQWKIDN